MTSVLANAINAFLDRDEFGTLVELRRFLIETKFRNSILETVPDPSIAYYWKHEFPKLKSNSIAPILTRLDTFIRSRVVRNMMAQRSGIDFDDVLNSRKILLVKLSQGLIGEENSYLLGSIIIAKLHQAALHRQNMKEAERTPFFKHVDEFQHFITPSMSAILSGARKYGLGLMHIRTWSRYVRLTGNLQTQFSLIPPRAWLFGAVGRMRKYLPRACHILMKATCRT